MEVIKTALDGVVIIEPRIFNDARGYFFESFSEKEFIEKVCSNGIGKLSFIQDNESRSSYGVLRGLHFQKGKSSQGKLVRVVRGKVLDVAVDIRKSSPTFMKHVAVELSEDNHRQLFIPRGFAHGFVVLSDIAVLQYKCDNYYDPASEAGIMWNDPALSIDWQIPAADIILSDKDKDRPKLDESSCLFDYNEKLY